MICICVQPLLALGAMLAHHARRAWVPKRNRISGSILVVASTLLTVTGYALYYLVSDTTHAPVSEVHWVLGLALVPLLIGHIILGRRSRGTALEGFAYDNTGKRTVHRPQTQ